MKLKIHLLIIAGLLISLLITSCSIVEPTPTPIPDPIPVIIDTDMALDDWLAILYLLNHPEVIVKAITVTGAGEAHCGPGVSNALKLISLTENNNIPVACGRETPLAGEHTLPSGMA